MKYCYFTFTNPIVVFWKTIDGHLYLVVFDLWQTILNWPPLIPRSPIYTYWDPPPPLSPSPLLKIPPPHFSPSPLINWRHFPFYSSSTWGPLSRTSAGTFCTILVNLLYSENYGRAGHTSFVFNASTRHIVSQRVTRHCDIFSVVYNASNLLHGFCSIVNKYEHNKWTRSCSVYVQYNCTWACTFTCLYMKIKEHVYTLQSSTLTCTRTYVHERVQMYIHAHVHVHVYW